MSRQELQFEGEIASEKKMAKIIAERRKIEAKRIEKGLLSFEALKSNFGLFPEKPEVFPRNPKATSMSVLKEDEIIQMGLRGELEKYELKPDNHTFYLIDIGLPHIPSLQSTLLDLEIDPAVYTAPSKKHLEEPNSAGHFSRYINAYEVLREELFQKREKLEKAKGYALLINSHAEKEEQSEIAKHLPLPEKLKKLGIRQLILAEEAFYGREMGLKDFKECDSPIWSYLRLCRQAGLEIQIVGIDYRHKHTKSFSGYLIMEDNLRDFYD